MYPVNGPYAPSSSTPSSFFFLSNPPFQHHLIPRIKVVHLKYFTAAGPQRPLNQSGFLVSGAARFPRENIFATKYFLEILLESALVL